MSHIDKKKKVKKNNRWDCDFFFFFLSHFFNKSGQPSVRCLSTWKSSVSPLFLQPFYNFVTWPLMIM